MEGMVFDIQRFAIHDGPGIRTSIFLKGCPLNCCWCQNPEGQSDVSQLMYFFNKCMKCHTCIQVCPENALSASPPSGEIHIDHQSCTLCGACVQSCPAAALAIEGGEMSVDEIIDAVLKDKIYYDVSGGGITITGGEPLSQPDFTIGIARRAHEEGLHTVLESSAFTDLHVLDELKKWIDLFLLDIKVISPIYHKKWTGVSNETILENIRYLSMTDADILVRIPLIPGYTANLENLEGIAEFLAILPRRVPCEMLNFNPLAKNKYRMLGRDYALSARTERFDAAEMEAFTMIFRDKGLVATWS